MKPAPADLDCFIQPIHFISTLVSDCTVYLRFPERFSKEATPVLFLPQSHSHVQTSRPNTCPISLERRLNMSTSDSPSSTKSTKPTKFIAGSRRKFLGQMSGATAATIAVGAIGLEPLLG